MVGWMNGLTGKDKKGFRNGNWNDFKSIFGPMQNRFFPLSFWNCDNCDSVRMGGWMVKGQTERRIMCCITFYP